jgi:hypothetical protein
MGRGTWIAAVLANVLAGCSSTRILYTPLVTPPRAMPPRQVDQVDVYVTTPPSRPHLDVGMLQVTEYRAGTEKVSGQEMMLHLKGGAAAQGCDAVLITALDMRSGRYSMPSIQGSCELYTDTPADHLVVLRASPPNLVVTIASAGADVRAAPSPAAQVITRLNPGLRLIVHPTSGGWSFVKLSDGRLGWVSDVAFLR